MKDDEVISQIWVGEIKTKESVFRWYDEDHEEVLRRAYDIVCDEIDHGRLAAPNVKLNSTHLKWLAYMAWYNVSLSPSKISIFSAEVRKI